VYINSLYRKYDDLHRAWSVAKSGIWSLEVLAHHRGFLMSDYGDGNLLSACLIYIWKY